MDSTNFIDALVVAVYLVLAFGFAWVALAVLSLSELFIGKYATASGYAIASIIFALCFKRVFGWHIARLDVSDRNRVEEPTESAPVS